MPMCRVLLASLVLTAVMASDAFSVAGDAEAHALSAQADTMRPAADEHIVLEADSLRPDEVLTMHSLELAQAAPDGYALENGRTLRLGRHTHAGAYVLQDGRVLRVYGSSLWPREFALQEFPGRGLWFGTVSARCVGVSVEISGDPSRQTEQALLADYFKLQNRPWLGGRRVPEDAPSHWVVKIGNSWFQRGFLQLPERRQGLARITWIAFDAVERPGAIVLAEQRIATGVVDSLAEARPPAEIGPRQTRNARVLGSVVVDLDSGRVVERSGAIR
jgi:hypothetical protein